MIFYERLSISSSVWEQQQERGANKVGLFTGIRPTPPKSATELGRVVRRLKKNVENDTNYKIKLNYNLSILVTSIRAKCLALKQMSIDNNFSLAT
jgi:hypothetical protein